MAFLLPETNDTDILTVHFNQICCLAFNKMLYKLYNTEQYSTLIFMDRGMLGQKRLRSFK